MRQQTKKKNFYKILSQKQQGNVVVELPSSYLSVLDMYVDEDEPFCIPWDKEQEWLQDGVDGVMETGDDIKEFLETL